MNSRSPLGQEEPSIAYMLGRGLRAALIVTIIWAAMDRIGFSIGLVKHTDLLTAFFAALAGGAMPSFTSDAKRSGSP